MSVIWRRCFVCHADPCARWKSPPTLIFVDRYHRDDKADKGAKYRCRAHLSPQREEEIQARERERGFSLR
jgi:hypothetical protein